VRKAKRNTKFRQAVRSVPDMRELERLSPGFKLPQTPTQQYTDADAFHDALRQQDDALAFVNGRYVQRIGLDGAVAGTDYRLTPEAFDDICRLGKAPSKFVGDLAQYNPELALEVLYEIINGPFHSRDTDLIVDTRDGLVLAAIDADKHSWVQPLDVFESAVTAITSTELSRGWVEGVRMHFSLLSPEWLEPRDGDKVRFGASFDVDNSMGCQAFVSDYWERLLCANGMTGSDKVSTTRVDYGKTADPLMMVQRAAVTAGARARELLPVMESAATLILPGEGLELMEGFVAGHKNGGKKVAQKVIDLAVTEAQHEGRHADEVTIWNAVNGITYYAQHETKTMKQQRKLEELGHEALLNFVDAFKPAA
jgi:hypothetical protein